LAEASTAKERMETMLTSINDGFYVLDRNWRFTYVNDRYCEMVQMPSSKLLGQNIWELFPAAVDTEAYELFHHAMADQTPRQFDYLYAPWNCWHDHRIYPSPTGLTVFIADISDRKQAEATLQISEERLQLAVRSAKLGMWFWDIETDTLIWTERCKALFDLPLNNSAITYADFMEALHPDDRQRTDEAVVRARQEQVDYDIEYRTIWQDGTVHWIAAKGSCIYNSAGEAIRMNGVAIDIDDRKQAEEEVRQNRDRLAFVLQATEIGLWLNSMPLSDLIWDDRTRALFFVPPNVEPTIELFWSRVHPEDREPTRLAIEEALRDRTLYGINHRAVNPETGEIRWIRSAGKATYASDGTPIRFDGINYDITELKQLEVELRQKNAILDVINESAPTPIFLKDRQGHIIYANPATLKVLGKTAEEVIGYRDCDLYPNPEDAARVMENDRRVMASGQMEVVEESPDGIRTFLGMKVPYYNEAGDVIGLIGVSNDITDRVQFERDRERILQQEQVAREAAENANRIKDEFLAVLSHELRSPLNPILGWAKLLQQGKLDATKTKTALATIQRNAQLQSQLIDDLLDISRILRGKLSVNEMPVDLSAVILAALETVRLAAEAKSLQIQTILTPHTGTVIGDAGRLQQVIWNLLSNAVKFTPQNGQVTITLTQIETHLQIRVTDTGKGISPEFLPYVFEHFRQEDGATTRKFGGLGLGLAIARQLVEMHGGTVWAESQGEKQGATFIVQLPVMPHSTSIASEPTRTQSEASLDNIQILLVDDEPDTREFQAFLLEQSGAKVMVVASGLEALQALDQFIPQVIISDIGMAEMDGYMLMQQIRSRPTAQGGTIPAIALTAYAGDYDQQQALQAGFQHHLAKPIEPDELIKTIATLTRKTSNG
jgi:PAS domain S-box-containing protein